MRGIVGSVVMGGVFLAYPYLVYIGIERGISWFAPALIAGIYLNQALVSSIKRIKIIKITIAIVLLIGAVFLQSITAKLLPIFIQLVLMHFFGRTLVDGAPIIERFVRLEFPEIPVEIAIYCRQLTVMWTCFFGFNAVMCAGLAIWASDAWWAIYNGVMIFILTGVLMVGEYIWRHFRFPELDIPSPQATIRNMIVNGREIWKDVHVR